MSKKDLMLARKEKMKKRNQERETDKTDEYYECKDDGVGM